MRIFLNANILVSVLNKEYPLFTWSSRILSLAGHKQFSLYTSPVCLAIAFYFAEKKSGALVAKKKTGLLARHLFIAEIGKSMVLQAVNNSAIHDFEDGIEYYAAKAAGCSMIISEDADDFYFSDIEILTSGQFFERYLNK
ncbi:MAG TPA: PIN domain-containing protein [Puia sp.]|nr:PIN domain-containing protein [Puia sp.]